jgi:proteasome lid subunit RPN8/RPN11
MATNKIRSQRLALEREVLVRRRQHLLGAFRKATESQRANRMNHLFRQLQQVNRSIDTLNVIEDDIDAAKQDVRQYVVSSLFLRDCFDKLTADSSENFFFITGPEVDGVCVLDQVAEFEHTRRTLVAVEGNPKSTHSVLMKLERFKHKLLAHFHSHPGTGLGLTMPSGTDRAFQSRLEQGGYPSVAAIFSRDGYVRFFRTDHNADVRVHGEGVEQVEPNIFRITDLDPINR